MSARSFRIVGAGIVSVALATSLSGCLVANNHTSVGDLADDTVQGALDDASSALDDAANAMSDIQADIADSLNTITEMLSNLGNVPQILDDLFGAQNVTTKTDRVVIEDAQTGKMVAELTGKDDLERLATALSGMSYASWEVVSSRPDTPAYRVLHCFQHDTVLLGQSIGNTKSSEVLTLTTFEDSNVIELTVEPVNFTLDLKVSDADLATLNGLA